MILLYIIDLLRAAFLVIKYGDLSKISKMVVPKHEINRLRQFIEAILAGIATAIYLKYPNMRFSEEKCLDKTIVLTILSPVIFVLCMFNILHFSTFVIVFVSYLNISYMYFINNESLLKKWEWW